MNDYDLNNFKYIMALSPSEYDEWLGTASDDDLAYLQELFDQRKTETHMAILEYEDTLAEFDVSLAQKVLAKYTLNRL